MSLLQTLNPKQKQAVEHVEGPMLVLAGAGSGKTRVVTHRIARLIDIGVSPSDILAVTFTNKAADEMRSRIQTMKNAHVLTCTFHSLGARILRESIHLLGYSNDFTIYDEEDSMKLLKSCFQSIGIKDEKGEIKTIKHRISTAKNDLISPGKISFEDKANKTDLLFQKIYPIYLKRLQEANALDFDDLLFLTTNLLKENEDARHLYQNKWLFILIDEYQDTNSAQYTLTKILSAKHTNIFAVGDPDQSIYSWRGAKYQNILNFDRDFPNAQIIRLEQNYRSTQNILQASNALIANNQQRYEKDLWSQLEEGEKIKVYFAKNDREEANFVVQTIETMCATHLLSLNDIVVFYRTNAQSRSFEDAFLAKRLPYAIVGGISFYQRKEIKDLLAILKVISSSSDFISFARILGFKKCGIGPSTLTSLMQASQKLSLPILTLCKELSSKQTSIVKLNTKQLSFLKKFSHIIETLREFSGPIHELIQKTLDQFEYFEVLKQDPESFEDRKENIEELISKAMETENLSLTQFLEEITLKSADSKKEEQSVKLMTVHNGKGLEFEMVFIIGLEEDLFPHVNSKDFPDKLEEERRLCYVAMTRAKKYLYLCGASYRFMWGSSRFMLPSRFVKELPAKYLENLSVIDESFSPYREENKAYPFKKGERVLHHEFGSGWIQNVYETSYGPTYDVYFEKENITRSLVGKYAKLRKHII